MSTKTTIDRLVSANVIEITDEDIVELSDVFEDEFAEQCEQIEQSTKSEIDTQLRSVLSPNDTVLLGSIVDRYPDLVARCLVLFKQDPDLSFEELLQLGIVVEQLQNSLPPTEGIPESLLPIHGEQLLGLIQLFKRAIVYVWRHDCEPCDIMKDEFDTLFNEPPDDVMLFAVYGPDCPQLLNKEFDIVGGPVTLFMVDGEVDCRLNGAHYQSVIEDEISVFRQR